MMKLKWRKIRKFLKSLLYALLRKKRVVGEYCEVDYSKISNQKWFAKHVRDLCDQHYEGVGKLVFYKKREDIDFTLIEEMENPAETLGFEIRLNMEYHSRVDDDGSIIHEMTHALMACPKYDASNFWLVEGIADYVRDREGFSTTWSNPHFETGGALKGYMMTAHFLGWMENIRSGTVWELSRLLVLDTYIEMFFETWFRKELKELVAEYEQIHR